MNKHDPTTTEEWQEAVDTAAAVRAVADCQMYGLIKGGPKVNLARCDSILEQGAARGVRPSKKPTDLAADFVHLWNESLKEAKL